MQRSGIKFVTGGDIEEIWDQTEDKQAQRTRRESFRTMARPPVQHVPF